MKRAQSLIDYGIIVGVAAIALSAMSGYMQRSLQAKTKDLADVFITSKQRVAVNKKMVYNKGGADEQELAPANMSVSETSQDDSILENAGNHRHTVNTNSHTSGASISPNEDPDKDINTVELLENIKSVQNAQAQTASDDFADSSQGESAQDKVKGDFYANVQDRDQNYIRPNPNSQE